MRVCARVFFVNVTYARISVQPLDDPGVDGLRGAHACHIWEGRRCRDSVESAGGVDRGSSLGEEGGPFFCSDAQRPDAGEVVRLRVNYSRDAEPFCSFLFVLESI